MSERVSRDRSEWLCIKCGRILGRVMGGELYPSAEPTTRTKGPNLVIYCPECNSAKTWYTSDTVVRAVYQLINAMSEVAAKNMVETAGKAIREAELRK